MKDKASMNEPVIQPKRTRKKYDNAFKRRAVELWLSSGRTATEVAAELGFKAQRLSTPLHKFAHVFSGG
jgi:transposase-like protein